jgi:hypothetical protein
LAPLVAPPAPLVPIDAVAGAVTHKDEVISKPKEFKPGNLPLFRYGAPHDIVSDVIEIGKKVWFKVFRNLVELIVLDGVLPEQIAFACWMIHHVDGPLLVNLPTQADPSALKHIMDIDGKTRIRDIVQRMTRSLIRYPTHFVVKSVFRLGKDNIIAGNTIREHLDEYYQKVTMDYLEGKM